MCFSLMEISATAPLKMAAIKTSAILMIVIVYLLIQIIVEEPTEEEVYSIVLIFIVF